MSLTRKRGCSSLVAGCALFLFALASGASQPLPYRLAGTIELPAARYLAIIESDSGTQRLVRVGDAIGDGDVISIGESIVRIRANGEVITLELEGHGTYLDPEVSPGHVVASMIVDDERLLMLEGLRRGEEEQLTADFLQELDLPADIKVQRVQISDVHYSSMKSALPQICAALDAGEFAHLFFEKGGPVDEIYLMPAQAPNNKN
jgi:hypothetical protein